MMDQADQIWRQGRRRRRVRMNALAAVALAAVLTIMANYLASRHYWVGDWTRFRYYTLSEKTQQMLGSLRDDVLVVAFFRSENDLYQDLRSLLKEYRHASRRLRVEFVDPDRDLARSKELVARYDLSEPNVLIVEAAGRRQYVRAQELAEYDYMPMLANQPRRKMAFKGEQVLSSVIGSLTQTRPPVVYFLQGHGEKDVDDFHPDKGYSSLARLIRRDNVEVRVLPAAEGRPIPDDCDALIIAGPKRRLPAPELEVIRAYLNRNGRLLLLLDAGMTTGLESILEEWGIKTGAGRVVDRAVVGIKMGPDNVIGIAGDGRALYLSEYGRHEITRRLKGLTTILYSPRAIEPDAATEAQTSDRADKPRVTVLARCTKGGWEENDPEQTPPKYEKGADRPGPLPVAVAVERGPVPGLDVQLRPTRIVVVGDSEFASNGTLLAGNPDFFLSAMNWLLSREELMAVAPKAPDVVILNLSPRQSVLGFVLMVAAMPVVVAALGFIVWIRRRS